MLSDRSLRSWDMEMSAVVMAVNRDIRLVSELVYMAAMTVHALLCEHLPEDLVEIVLECLRPTRRYWRIMKIMFQRELTVIVNSFECRTQSTPRYLYKGNSLSCSNYCLGYITFQKMNVIEKGRLIDIERARVERERRFGV